MRFLYLIWLCICMISCRQGDDKTDTTETAANKSQQEESAEQPLVAQPAASNEKLIAAGERIGKTTLGITADSLSKLLGKPDESDAAMGKAWLSWFGKRDEHNNSTRLDVYTTYRDSNMMEKTVQQIHATSSYFSTADGVHVYSSMNDIRKVFPDLKKSGEYASGGRTVMVYDDEEQGIAFEQASASGQDICIGILVHPKGKPVNSTYISLLPDAKIR